ncbi:MAG: DUF1513 domain-containing protein [Pseudomonadales bacterium]|nr:DUF1513 domain-containing protein [Halieaceae bacterium]MCP5189355.1 DUF1513 domain-containing protein [Pseudomonadales bacterium]
MMSNSGGSSAGFPRLGRRRLLAGLGGALLLAGLPGLAARAAAANRERWVAAQGDSSDSYSLGWLDGEGTGSRATFTGFRGHAVLQHALRADSVVFVARRPGTRALEVDLASGDIIGGFGCAPGRHLFGHGCFSGDGAVFFTTEGDIAAGVGRIVVRDADSYRILEDWPSHGIGPHDIRLLPDGKTLVVANGGILTRPATGREPLNLDTMCSTLSYIDAASGTLLDEYRVAEPKASIRHLDVAADGTVAFAIQLQRAAAGHDRSVPLAGVHRPGEALTLFSEPDAVIANLRDYVGSVAICGASRVAGFASPHGNLAAFWCADSGELRGYHRLRDVCGIAVSPRRGAFVVSNSLGEMRELDAVTLQERPEGRVVLPGCRWDNHLLITETA